MDTARLRRCCDLANLLIHEEMRYIARLREIIFQANDHDQAINEANHKLILLELICTKHIVKRDQMVAELSEATRAKQLRGITTFTKAILSKSRKGRD